MTGRPLQNNRALPRAPVWMHGLVVSLLIASTPRAGAAALPRLSVYVSRAIPWVGRPVSGRAVLRGTHPGEKWRLVLKLETPDGRNLRLAAKTASAGPGGCADLQTTFIIAKPGWYRLSAQALGPADRPRLQAHFQLPVTRKRVDFAWYQAENGRELRWPTIQLTAGKPEQQRYWRRRGVLPARWCGAACGKDKPESFFARKWSNFPAIAIDEFGGTPEVCEKFCRALKTARRRRPDEFIAVWFTGASQYWTRLRNTIDLFLPEVYLNYGPYHLTRFDALVRTARKHRVFHKMLPGLGINVVRNKDGAIRRRPTIAELVREIAYLKQIAPDLRGLAFFTYSSAEPAVRAAMDQACRDYFLAPVADLVSARVVPESAPPATPLALRIRIRNAGGMPALPGIPVAVFEHGRPLARASVPLASGEEKTLHLAVHLPPGCHELEVRIPQSPGLTRLRNRRRIPVVRLPAAPRIPVLYVPPLPLPFPWGIPLEVRCKSTAFPDSETTITAAKFPLSPRISVPAWNETTPSGAGRLYLLPPPLPAEHSQFWQLRPATPAATPSPRPAPGPVCPKSGIFRYRGTTYTAELDLNSDQIRSIRTRDDNRELLRGPWRMKWKAWNGFGPAKTIRFLEMVEVRIPVNNEKIRGETRYLFCPGCIEIQRWFTASKPVTVTYAAEGAEFAQHPGAYAAQFGVGAEPGHGRLAVSRKYRDIYFGSPDLTPESAQKGGWFDFAWNPPYAAGLGVVIARQWRRRASKVGYDVTRWYDASDWLEIIQVWNRPISTRGETSRIFLLPHGYADFTNPKTVSAAAALWQRLHAPARILSALPRRG